ncbi:DUF4336 domain-containing protein [Nodosilinea sp. LEGE 06152]|uniref:DUF4336 domain-containing protein n=1 Tax=Nodosilinea sp. LEGE 06152 TaxID=2777966 RepID=UPI001882EC3C|nr:DUF4336 domain-containing protein [Nodosilinea sp. LEGE 06152]MBE9155427.1 DUF4336 domain-containing protein [Nodosilinea sp. LEGE 06152]
MLKAVDRDLWVVEQPFRYFGLGIGTRMTVVRLAGNELVVISPIQVSDGLVSELNELGTVAHIIAPNLYHYLFAAEFKAVYPAATFWATAGLRAKKPELAIDRAICHRQGFANADSPEPPWPGLEYLFFDGFKTLAPSGPDPLEEWVFLHIASRTLILTDTAFCFDESFPWLTQLVTKIGGGYKSLSPSLLERVATTEKAKVKASVEQVLRWDFERVIVAHGSIVEGDGKSQFKRGYETFLGCSL